MFELPGFATPAAGAKQDSLDALRSASTTSYFKSDDALWVKLVVENTGAAAPAGPGGPAANSIEVSR
jgi:hypothetical protein